MMISETRKMLLIETKQTLQLFFHFLPSKFPEDHSFGGIQKVRSLEIYVKNVRFFENFA